MTDDVLAAQEADDAKLLNLVRSGNSGAFVVLRQRHEQAARRLAGELVGSAAEVDELLERTFAQVLDETSDGGGPTDAFRPYLLTAVRLACDGDPAADGSDAPGERSLMAAAFFALPERWIAVLWHTEIESASAVHVAPLLGLSPEGVAALRRRAREGLRQTYLQLHASRTGRSECRPVWEQLGAFIRDPGPGPESALVTEHLSECDDCSALYADLADVNLALRTLVAPVVLGRATAAYLSAGQNETAAVPGAAPAGAHRKARIGAAMASAGTGRAAWFRAPLTRGSLQPLHLLAAAAVIVVGGAAFAVSLAGHDTPVGSAHHPRSAAGGTPFSAVLAPASSRRATASGTVAPSRTPGSTPAWAPASKAPTGSVSPGPTAIASSPPAVQLTASVSISGQQAHWHGAQVDFQVNNTGSAATGKLTVSITLPAGAWLFGGDDGHGDGHGDDGGQGHTSQAHGGDGWSCQATSAGASCKHAAISPGGQAQGLIYIGFDGSSACGQPIGLTVSSGSASASAQSAQDLQC